MKTVYLVTDGDYEDYHVRAVFSNPEDAEKFRKYHALDRVENYFIDPKVPGARKDKYLLILNNDGTLKDYRVDNERMVTDWVPVLGRFQRVVEAGTREGARSADRP